MINAERINSQLSPLCEKVITSVDPGVGLTINAEMSTFTWKIQNIQLIFPACWY